MAPPAGSAVTEENRNPGGSGLGAGQVSNYSTEAAKLVPRPVDRDAAAWLDDRDAGAPPRPARQAHSRPVQVYDPRGKDEGKPENFAGMFGAVAASRAWSVGAGEGTSGEELARRLLARDQLAREPRGATLRFLPVTVEGVELQLEPLQPAIGTVVHGVDLAKPLSEGLVRFLRQQLLERRVICFRDQAHVTSSSHKAFAARFGHVGAVYGEARQGESRPTARFLSTAEGPNAVSIWHSDVTWAEKPPLGSLLMCREAPPVGGDTLFCDAYAMYEGLPARTRARLQALRALHRGELAHANPDGSIPQTSHPALRTHPETGGTTLFVNPNFTRQLYEQVPGDIPEEESELILAQCFALCGKPEFTCRFRWEPGSLAFWDNRACQHYGSGDYWPHTRRMERFTVLDDVEARRRPYYRPGAKL